MNKPAKVPAPTPLLPGFAPGARLPAAGGDGDPILRSSDGQQRRLKGPCRVGSAPDNDWVLGDRHVSQHHLILTPLGDRVLVSDCGSTNGTRVNGVLVKEAEVPAGGYIELGGVRLHHLRSEGGGPALARLVGQSAAMRELRSQIQAAARIDASVLILGESGTGKDLVAQALHELSGRRGPFIAVNCGGLPAGIIESELFGHEKGSFTGAAQRRGCFREASGGTLFLDEIGDMPLEQQPRLLRALEARKVRPVGADAEVPIDAQVIAATHRDLDAARAEGRFRGDLFYRLDKQCLHVPPLRERAEDIPLLVRHFLQKHAGQHGPRYISDEELEIVAQHPWPGNVRELQNAVERAAHLGLPVLSAQDLLPRSARAPSVPYVRPAAEVLEAAEPAAPRSGGVKSFEEIEREAILAALRQTSNNGRAAAALLRIPKSTFFDKLKRLGIDGGKP